MKRRALQIAVVVGLVAAAFVFRSRHELPATPEDTGSAWFDAAEAGDDDAYLRLVDGELAESLRQSRTQLGARAFCDVLKRSAAKVKGFAVERSGAAPAGLTALEVDIVFADRNECQRMLLRQRGGGWVITSIETARTVAPSIPYGTPVFEEPPQPAGQEQGATQGSP